MEYYLRSFIVGGTICFLAQILIDKTKITPARVMVSFVILGAILSAFNVYDAIIYYSGCGASVPIIGFGHCLVKGVKKNIEKWGFIGAFTGGIEEASAGISTSIFFALLMSILFSPKEKK